MRSAGCRARPAKPGTTVPERSPHPDEPASCAARAAAWRIVMFRCLTRSLAIVWFAFALFASPALAQESFTVFAAASLKNALDDVDTAFAKATGIKVTASYAASSTLAKQIEQGAPADVFASADIDWMDYGH